MLTFLRGHAEAVNSLSVRGLLMASGSDDRSVRIWDLRTCKSLSRRSVKHVSHASLAGIDNVLLHGDMQLYASNGARLLRFDLRGKELFVRESASALDCDCEDLNQIAAGSAVLGLPGDDGSLQFVNTDTQEIDLCIEAAHESVPFL